MIKNSMALEEPRKQIELGIERINKRDISISDNIEFELKNFKEIPFDILNGELNEVNDLSASAKTLIFAIRAMYSNEIKYVVTKPVHNYKPEQPEVYHLFSVIFSIANKYNFPNKVIFTAVDICHKVLSITENSLVCNGSNLIQNATADIDNVFNIHTEETRIRLAVMIMFIAQKIHPRHTMYTEITELSRYGKQLTGDLNCIDNKFNKDLFITMELFIWAILDLKFNNIIANNFVSFYIKAANLTDIQESIVYYYLYLGAYNQEVYKYLPSRIAAAAIYIALELTTPENQLESIWSAEIAPFTLSKCDEIENEVAFLKENAKWRTTILLNKNEEIRKYKELCYNLPKKCQLWEDLIINNQ